MTITVLLIGATGVFGQRLAEQLAVEPGVNLQLAGRTMTSLISLQEKLNGTGRLCQLDRNKLTAEQLRQLGCDVIIDAAGPFQHSHTQVVQAAIESGCHYIDLADGRDFVHAIRQFNQQAVEQQVAVISGASSTPALSHAVVDELTENWRSINTIKVAISPGNRAPRGLAVMQAILSYAGKPVCIFRHGQWQHAPGWGLTHTQHFPDLGNRLLSLCDTPDLDLLVERFHPQTAAEFYAGLELRILHRGLQWCSQLVRWRLVKSLRPWARPMRFIASLFLPFGTDRGGMLVQVTGSDQHNRQVQAQWTLSACAGKGPYVPTLAALALVRRLRDKRLAFRGAAACTAMLDLKDFYERFRYFDIQTISTLESNQGTLMHETGSHGNSLITDAAHS